MGKRVELTGKRFGRLVVISEDGKTAHGDLRWLCKCDCGNTKTITGNKLRSGWTHSCGCLQREWAKENFSTHKMSKSSIHNIWECMKSRCYYKGNSRYYRYGARGIKICEEWQDFINFYNWAINNGYKEGLSIERIDIDKDYEPSNCCWIPRNEQQKNTSRTVWVKYKDQKLCMSEFARLMDVSVDYVSKRLKKQMSGKQIAKELGK